MNKKFQIEMIAVEKLKEHPKNYREHPEDQLKHLESSLKRYGFYRNVIVAKEDTILAGHGVVKAAKKIGVKEIPVIRLNVAPDDTDAIRVLIGDNEIEHLAEQNDRLLTELLKELSDKGTEELLGTGLDKMMLANLVYVTRPESEISTFDEAAEWVGMPEYDGQKRDLFIIVSFKSKKDREAFAKLLGAKITDTTKSLWYPLRAQKADIKAVRFIPKNGKSKAAAKTA